jgi:hypothetical protein
MSRKGDSHWTEHEVAWLKHNIATMNYKELALALDKPYQAITSKVLRLGLKTTPANKRHGKLNGNWKGGKSVRMGYVLLNQLDRFEHQVIMEKKIGRVLEPHEVIHHIDGVKTFNNISNLHLCNRSTHRDTHHSLELAAFELFRKGIIRFSKKTGNYYISNNSLKAFGYE